MFDKIFYRLDSHKEAVYFTSLLLVSPILIQFVLMQNKFISEDTSLWIDIKIGTAILLLSWLFLTASVITLLRIRIKYLIIPLFVSIIVSTYIVRTGQNIEYEVYAAINNTNRREAVELLLSPYFAVPFVVVIFLFISLYKTVIDFERRGVKSNKGKVSWWIILLLVSLAGLSWSYLYNKDRLYRTYPLNIPYYQKMYLEELVLFKRYFEKLSYVPVDSTKDSVNDGVYILIIGESARKQSMSAYGYKRPTTPNIDRLLIQKPAHVANYNGVSAGVSTRLSVPLLLSTANVTDNDKLRSHLTLVHVFKGMGFDVTLISNQEEDGRNNDIISMMTMQADNVHYINGEGPRTKYDAELLPYLANAIESGGGRQLIIMHLMGSHFKYKNRYPHRFNKFGDQRIDTYDNSILYTDYLLGMIEKNIASADAPVIALYTSDHGENMNDSGDGNYLHTMGEMTPYEIGVPFFVFINDLFLNKQKNKVETLISRKGAVVSHDSISHMFLGFLGLKDERVYNREDDLSSSFYIEHPAKTVNRRREIVEAY